MTNLDTLMNSSLAAVAETDFQPFTDPAPAAAEGLKRA